MRNPVLSGIGFILMLVVMVIVLLLVARAWTSVAPTAVQITSPQLPGADTDADGDADDGEESGRLLSLNEMKENTEEHAKQLDEAREAIDQ